MGACASVSHTSSPSKSDVAPPQKLHVQAKQQKDDAAAGSSGSDGANTGEEIEMKQQPQQKPVDVKPEAPDVFPAAATHPFGLPLLHEEIRALYPPNQPHAAEMSEQQLAHWKQDIMPDAMLYRNAQGVEWNKLIANGFIPSDFRVALWEAALEVNSASMQELNAHPYSYYLTQKNEEADSQIGRDIYRTFSTHGFFAYRPIQRCIGRVLHCWACVNPKVGYVQGMNYIVALFLMTTLDEEKTFRCFLSYLAHPSHGMSSFYSNGLSLLMETCSAFERVLEKQTEKLYNHLKKKHHLDAIMYATPFYLTAFTHHLTLEACVHVFDFILLANLSHVKLASAQAASSKHPSSAAVAAAPTAELSTSRIATCITQLACAVLLEQKDRLLKESRTDQLFQQIQQLHILDQAQTRNKVFHRALDSK